MLHSLGNAGGWVRAASILPCLPVSGLAVLPLKPAGTLGESSCQLLACRSNQGEIFEQYVKANE